MFGESKYMCDGSGPATVFGICKTHTEALAYGVWYSLSEPFGKPGWRPRGAMVAIPEAAYELAKHFDWDVHLCT